MGTEEMVVTFLLINTITFRSTSCDVIFSCKSVGLRAGRKDCGISRISPFDYIKSTSVNFETCHEFDHLNVSSSNSCEKLSFRKELENGHRMWKSRPRVLAYFAKRNVTTTTNPNEVQTEFITSALL